MKRLYTLLACLITAIGSLFAICNPVIVAAETSHAVLVEQAQINTLVTMAKAPYKW